MEKKHLKLNMDFINTNSQLKLGILGVCTIIMWKGFDLMLLMNGFENNTVEEVVNLQSSLKNLWVFVGAVTMAALSFVLISVSYFLIPLDMNNKRKSVLISMFFLLGAFLAFGAVISVFAQLLLEFFLNLQEEYKRYFYTVCVVVFGMMLFYLFLYRKLIWK